MAVVCRPPELRPGTTDVVLNPKVVVEVLVSQREPRIALYTRQHDGSFRFATNRASLALHGLSVDIDDIYSEAFELPGDDA